MGYQRDGRDLPPPPPPVDLGDRRSFGGDRGGFRGVGGRFEGRGPPMDDRDRGFPRRGPPGRGLDRRDVGGPRDDFRIEEVDREKVCPMLLRLFCKQNEHHSDDIFSYTSQPVDSEVSHTSTETTLELLRFRSFAKIFLFPKDFADGTFSRLSFFVGGVRRCLARMICGQDLVVAEDLIND